MRKIKYKQFLEFCIIALVLSTVHGVTLAQTIFGQSGTILAPSADTYQAGNFLLSGYFRSMSFNSNRFDLTPISLITGVAPRLEIGFEFPSIWGGTPSPEFTDDFAQLSVKYRLHGKNEDPWRLALSGLLQRGVSFAPATSDNNGFSTGAELISSHNFYKNYHFHLYGGGVVAATNNAKDQLFGGVGVDRFIASKLQFLGDLMGATRKTDLQSNNLQSLVGLRYYPLPNLQITIGGGLGLTDDDFEWQYLIGLSLTSDFRNVNLFEGQEELLRPPPLEIFAESIPPPAEAPSSLPSPEVIGGKMWAGEIEMASRLFFDFAGYRLGENEAVAFNELQNELEEFDPTVPLRVIGHADQIGDVRENYAWGITRAINVAMLLNREVGISLDRLLITSSGEESPSDRRISLAANQLNRRVVVRTWYNFISANQNSRAEGESWQVGDGPLDGQVLNTSVRLAASDVLREIGEIDTTEALLIEAGWQSNSDPLIAIQRASAIWLLAISYLSVNPDQIYLHLFPEPGDLPGPEDSPPSPMTVDLQGHRSTPDSLRIELLMKNLQPPTEIQEGRMILVADYPHRRVTSTGDILEPNQAPDPGKGRKFRFRKLITPSFILPVQDSSVKLPLLSLYVFDRSGQLLDRFPVQDLTYEQRWLKRIGNAWGNKTQQSKSGGSLKLKVISVSSNQ